MKQTNDHALEQAVEAELQRMKQEAPENYYMDGEYKAMGLSKKSLDSYWRKRIRAKLAPKMGYEER